MFNFKVKTKESAEAINRFQLEYKIIIVININIVQ